MHHQRLEEVIYFVIERTMKRVKQHSMQAFQAHGFDLTIDQWITLKRIAEHNGINQVDLVASLYKDPASITRILDLLRKKGLVEKRTNAADRRRFDLHLTPAGKNLHDRMLDLVVDLRKTGIAGLSTSELEQMKQTLDKIYHNVDAPFVGS